MENFFDNDKEITQSNSKIIYIFGDVETTGLSEEKERMTEIALVKTDSNFNIIDRFQTLINPEREIIAKITEITGITEEMIADEPKYEDILPVIEEWWYKDIDEDSKIVFVAHNCPFDKKFINKASSEFIGEDLIVDFIDTVSLARHLYPFWKNHKLETCADKFGVVNENHHRAMNDTMVLYYIGQRLINECMEEEFNPVNFLTTSKKGR